MAKLQTYKFVNPGVAGSKSPAVGAVRKQTLAINRLGQSVSSVQQTIVNLGAIAAASQKLEDAEAIKARKQKRREADAAAEEAAETGKLENKQKKKQKPDSKLKKKGKLGFGNLLSSFLGPIGGLLLKIASLALITETLKWIGDPENKEKLVTFLEKTKFVFEKLFGYASLLVGTFLDGFSALMDPQGDFISKITGLGKLLVGIIGLRYLMNPFALIGDILGLMDIMDQGDDLPIGDDPDPRIKPKQPKPPSDLKLKKMGLNPEQIKEYKRLRAAGEGATEALGNAKKFKPKKGLFGRLAEGARNTFDAGVDIARTQGTRLKDFLVTQAKAKYKQLSNAAVEAYANLGEKARKRWEQMVDFTKMAKRKGGQFASGLKDKASKAGDWVGGKLSKAGNALKDTAIKKVIEPVKKFIDPIMTTVKGIGEKVVNTVLKTPAGAAIEQALKKKGLSITKPGPLAKKIGGKALPVIGGLLNALFAYDRFQSGDVIGGMIEGLSGAFDISGLFGFVPGPYISMGLDAYMFARDLVPGIQEMETGIVDAIPGMKTLRPKIEGFAKGLPPLGSLFNIFGGKGDLDKQPTDDYDGTAEGDREGPVEIQPPGSEIESNQEMFLGGVVKGITKAVGSVGNAVSGALNSPIGQIAQSVASFIPGAAPIMAGINTLASGNPMSMLGMIPGVGGMMSQVGNFMNSPVGQIGSSLLSGNFGAAASSAVSMIPGASNLGGAVSGFLSSSSINPVAGISSLADNFGIGNLMKSVTGAVASPESGMSQIAGELGVNPASLGVTPKSSQSSKVLGQDGMSAQMMMQETMEFIPIPVIIEKLMPIPQAVPINTPVASPTVTAAPGLSSRMN